MRCVVFGDDRYGVAQLIEVLPSGSIVAVVAASIRPEQGPRLEALARLTGAKFLVQPKRDTSEFWSFVAGLNGLKPDLFFVHGYAMRLDRDVLASARLGAVNLHAALLPRFRGPNPIQWAMIARERRTGVTLHEVTENIDSGPIIAQATVPILLQDTWCKVLERIISVSKVLLEENLDNLFTNTAPRVPQTEADALTCRRRTPEDGEFTWAWPAIDIFNHIRALVLPLPGAYCRNALGRTIFQEYVPLSEILREKLSRSVIVGQSGLEIVCSKQGETSVSFNLGEPNGVVFEGEIDFSTLYKDGEIHVHGSTQDIRIEQAKRVREALEYIAFRELCATRLIARPDSNLAKVFPGAISENPYSSLPIAALTNAFR